jgi:hypothetical protein
MNPFPLAIWASLTNSTVWFASTKEAGTLLGVAWLIFAFAIWLVWSKE